MTALHSAVCIAVALLFLFSCGRGQRWPELEEIPKVVLSEEMDRYAEEQYQKRWQRLDQARANSHTQRSDLAIAYAEVGIWYQAYRFFDLAAVCYQNAGKLDPENFRWPYFLGHVAARQDDKATARKNFELVLKLRPRYVPALTWLAEIELEDNLQVAKELFEQTLEVAPQSARARFGLGQIALEGREHATAIRQFEAILAEQPEATSVHYALGMAYRGVGDLAQAKSHLERARIRENTDRVHLEMMDPLLARVQQLTRQRPSNRVKRAETLFGQRRYAEAAEILREEIAMKDGDPGLQFLLGLVYRGMGKTSMAKGVFQGVLRLAPSHGPAHFQLALLLALDSRDAEAEIHYREALKADPGHRNAHIRYGDLLRRQNRFSAALDHYNRAVELDGTHPPARFARVACLVRLGRWVEAHEALEESLLVVPGARRLRHLQARLLATNPVAELRDGHRAIQLVSVSADSKVGVQQAETMAMAYAELGRFDDAIRWQGNALDATRMKGNEEMTGWIGSRLALYRRGEPCRDVWIAGEAETLSELR